MGFTEASEKPSFSSLDVCGGFNEVLYDHEKRGRSPCRARNLWIFHMAISDCGLLDIGFT